MKRIEAMVKPELLVWARESAGLSQAVAAKKAQVKTERLASWERGENRPTINQLRKLGNAYKRPIAVFYLPKPPKDFQAMRDFRRLPGQVAGVETPALRLEIRKAHYRREIALSLFESLGEKPPHFRLTGSIDDNPEDLASRIREALSLTHEEQTSWRQHYKALNGWRRSLERCGVLVFQASGVEVTEMRGFSLADDALPVVVVNVKDHPHGRIFSMLHELAHLSLRREGLCDLVEDASRPPEEQQIEIFCNRLAGAIAMPADQVLAEPLVQDQENEVWSDEKLSELSMTFSVSREAMLRRLLTLDRTTREFYQTKRRQFLKEYERSEKKKEGFAPPDRRAVSAAGPAFVRLVLDSFYQEKITSSDVSDYLEVKLKWMPKIEKSVFDQPRDIWAFA